MKTATPAEKLKMMKDSLRCLVLGLMGLVPVIGLPFAVAAMWYAGQGRIQEKYFWNPARPQRLIGFGCAIFGALLWSGIDAIIVYKLLNDPSE